MHIETIPELENRAQTASLMYVFANKFKNDLLPYQDWSVVDFFEKIKNIPYIQDIEERETIARPDILLNQEYFTKLDCKKKNSLMAAFFEMKGLDYIFVASSDAPEDEPHHIFILLWNDGDWIEVDATFRNNKLGMERELFNYEIFNR